jgi:hypothetical protein
MYLTGLPTVHIVPTRFQILPFYLSIDHYLYYIEHFTAIIWALLTYNIYPVPQLIRVYPVIIEVK